MSKIEVFLKSEEFMKWSEQREQLRQAVLADPIMRQRCAEATARLMASAEKQRLKREAYNAKRRAAYAAKKAAAKAI